MQGVQQEGCRKCRRRDAGNAAGVCRECMGVKPDVLSKECSRSCAGSAAGGV